MTASDGRHNCSLRADGKLRSVSDRAETIEAGKFEDLIAVVGERVADLYVLENVRFVMKDGEITKDRWQRSTLFGGLPILV